MSGIAGVWHRDGRPIDIDVLARMSGAIRHRGLDGEDRWIDGPFGLAHQHRWVPSEEIGERQPLTGRRGARLVMDGRLDNRDELLNALDAHASTTDAGLALLAYERWDDAFPERLNGEFAIAVIDAAMRRVLLARDAIGVRPLYYAQSPKRFLFASEIKSLLAHPDVSLKADDEGIADYLMMDARPLDRQQVTCFAGVLAVVPSHLVIVGPDRVSVRRYWDFDTGRALRLRSFGDYVDAFRERFARAVARRTRAGAVAVSVSGGLDSSSIFCQAEMLRRSGAVPCERLLGISYTGAIGTDADEREYQKAIEREYETAFERFPIEPLTGLVDGVDDQVRTVEAPFIDYLWGVTRELQRRAQASGARVLLSGLWGDQVLFSSAYLVDLFGAMAWGRLLRHAAEYRRFFGPGETRILMQRVPMDLARHHLPRALVSPLKWMRRRLTGDHRRRQWFSDRFLEQACRHADQPASIGSGFHSAHGRSIYLEARSKYHVHCLEWNNKIAALHGLDISFPFMDRDLLAFLIAVPGDIQNRDGVPRALLREALRGVLPDAVRARRWKANFSDVVNQSVAGDADAIAGGLSDSALVVRLGYVDASRLGGEIRRLVEKLSGPVCTASWDLSDLYALERWLQVFLRRREESPE